jgi:exopolysaccharide biosynthesis polyprenyl glycosylphosphotransferase
LSESESPFAGVDTAVVRSPDEARRPSVHEPVQLIATARTASGGPIAAPASPRPRTGEQSADEIFGLKVDIDRTVAVPVGDDVTVALPTKDEAADTVVLMLDHEPTVAIRTRDDAGTTAVIPYAGSRTARRTRRLRAWMVAVPVDFAAMAAPLLWESIHWKGTLFAATLTVVLFAAGGLYRGRRHMSILDELPSVIGRLLVAAAIVAVIAAQRHESVAYVAEFMRNVTLSAGLVLVGRAITRKIVITARRRRWVEHGAIIVGGGPVATEMARLLRRYPQYGLRFVGFIADDDGDQTKELSPLIGRVDELEEMIAATESDVIIIADSPAAAEAKLVEIVRRPAAMTCDLLVVPRLHDFSTQGSMPDHIGAIPVMRIRRPTITGPKWFLKRTFDIVFALVSLVLLSPILLLCAVAVYIEGGWGIFFRQQRLGRHGKPFNLIKFRSMRPANEHESQTNWSVSHDKRVGPVGRFLRRTSLDELPQLWNILRGDMTLVGPRPERPYFAEKFSAQHPHYDSRHRVPMGLTGLAQVSGLRGDTPIADRARFDNYYIENWSLWLDIKVFLRSFIEFFRGGRH